VESTEVQVFDDCLDARLFQDLLEFVQRPIWAFGWASKPEDIYRYWHAHFTQSDSSLSATKQLEQAGHTSVLNAWNLIQKTLLPQYQLRACFASAHTFGCGSQYHTDGKPGFHDASAILYAHSTWLPEWGGELVFETTPQDLTQLSILPRPNRLVVQPPDVPHAVRSPSRDCPALRVCLVFRLKKI
jgi:SM-20-related protein